MANSQMMEQRLVALEEKEKSNASVILDLRNEVIDLQKDNVIFQRERSSLVGKVSQLESDVKDLHGKNITFQKDIIILKTERSPLVDKMSQMETEIKDHQTNVKKMEQVMSTQAFDSYRNQRSVTKQMTDLEKQVTQMEEFSKEVAHLKKLRQLFNHMIVNVKDHNNTDINAQNHTTDTTVEKLAEWKVDKTKADEAIKTVVDREIDGLKIRNDTTDTAVRQLTQWRNEKTKADKTMETRIDGLETKCDGHDKSLKTAQEKHDLTSTVPAPTHFRVGLNTKQALVAGQHVLLDAYENVLDTKGWFDAESCCVVIKQGCAIVLAWRLYQTGKGDMKAYLATDDGDYIKDYLGMTTHKSDMLSGCMVRNLPEGRKVWLEVERVKGDAKVNWCHLMGWVIGY